MDQSKTCSILVWLSHLLATVMILQSSFIHSYCVKELIYVLQSIKKKKVEDNELNNIDKKFKNIL